MANFFVHRFPIDREAMHEKIGHEFKQPAVQNRGGHVQDAVDTIRRIDCSCAVRENSTWGWTATLENTYLLSHEREY